MKIKTIKVERSHKAAKAFVKEKGATRNIGSGCYGTVYSDKELNVVFKIGDVSINRGYLSFLRQVIKQKELNPFTPQIHSITVFDDGEDKHFVVEMEKLKPLKRGLYPAARTIADLMYNTSDHTKLEKGARDLGFVIHIPKEIKDLVKLIKRAHYNANRAGDWDAYDWDLHMGNFMMRGDQIVVTDPIA